MAAYGEVVLPRHQKLVGVRKRQPPQVAPPPHGPAPWALSVVETAGAMVQRPVRL